MDVGDVVVGTVASWIERSPRSFGFARVDGRDLFIGATRLLNATELRQGDKVRAEIRKDRQGRLYGDNIELLDAAGEVVSV